MVAEGDADLGILPTAYVPIGYDFSPMFAIERVLVAPKSHPIGRQGEPTFSGLARWPMVMLSTNSQTRRLMDEAFEKRGLHYDIIVETNSIEAIKLYVAGGTGISMLPDISVSAGDAAELDIYPLSNLLIPEQVGVVTLRGKPISSIAQNFIDELATIGSNLE